MKNLFEDDDLEPFDSGCFSPGMPDPESADSLALWINGLLEDPLMDSDK